LKKRFGYDGQFGHHIEIQVADQRLFSDTATSNMPATWATGGVGTIGHSRRLECPAAGRASGPEQFMNLFLPGVRGQSIMVSELDGRQRIPKKDLLCREFAYC
jgi:hypothetical protein